MAWLAVDKDGIEIVTNTKPFKSGVEDKWQLDFDGYDKPTHFWVSLPTGTIKKLIGRKLTWKDEPVEI